MALALVAVCAEWSSELELGYVFNNTCTRRLLTTHGSIDFFGSIFAVIDVPVRFLAVLTVFLSLFFSHLSD